MRWYKYSHFHYLKVLFIPFSYLTGDLIPFIELKVKDALRY